LTGKGEEEKKKKKKKKKKKILTSASSSSCSSCFSGSGEDFAAADLRRTGPFFFGGIKTPLLQKKTQLLYSPY
jgi:hypothetical protein